MRISKLLLWGIFCCSVQVQAQPATKLPPKKPKNSSEQQLGESEAVKEVQRITQESTESTETSGAVAPVVISGGATEALRKSKKKEEEELAKSKTETPKDPPEPSVPPSPAPKLLKAQDQSAQEPPQSRLWLVLEKKPELGFTSGWVFMRKELATLVGGGFSYGFVGAQEFEPNLQAQVRLSGSHHRESDGTRKSSLNLFPLEVLVQFAKQYGNFKVYVQPGLGGAAWFAKSERLVDGYIQDSHGFDFMASGGLGAQYLVPHQPWRFGMDASLSYVSGYFDNYFTRVLVYTSYQF